VNTLYEAGRDCYQRHTRRESRGYKRIRKLNSTELHAELLTQVSLLEKLNL